jgi:hypothetical protein
MADNGETAPTRFIEAEGIRLVYSGSKPESRSGLPEVLIEHLTLFSRPTVARSETVPSEVAQPIRHWVEFAGAI